MSRHFTATILLERPWPLDIDAVGAAVEEHYPEIGRIESVPGQASGLDSGLLRIDGGHVVLTSDPQPVPGEQLSPELKLLRSWDPAPAIRSHQAHLTISCGGRLPGLEGAEAYAAAVHFVAAAVTHVAPALAVFWQRSYTLTEPGLFREKAARLVEGRMPLGAWVGFASIVPKGYSEREAIGTATYGLRHFIGRELELAPRPCEAKEAFELITSVARPALDRGIALSDGQKLTDVAGTGTALTVRERTYWLRRKLSAFVLVAEDSVVDSMTLKPRRPSAA